MGAYPGAVIDLQVQRDGSVLDVVSNTRASISRIGGKLSVGIDPETGRLKWFDGQATNAFLQTTMADQAALDTWSTSSGLTNAATHVLGGPSSIGMGNEVTLTPSGGTVGYFYRSIPTAGEPRTISFYVRKADGSAVTTADCGPFINNSGGTTNMFFIPVAGTTWYRAFKTGSSNATTSLDGIVVLANKSVIVCGLMDEIGVQAGTMPSTWIPTTNTTVSRAAAVISEPYLNGGYSAIIESNVYNYASNSFGLQNNGTAWTGWAWATWLVNGTPTYSLTAGCFPWGSTAMRLQYQGVVADSGSTQFYPPYRTANSSFNATENCCFSAYLKGSCTGVMSLDVLAYDAGGTLLGTQNGALIQTQLSATTWKRFSTAYLNLPTNTSSVKCYVYIRGFNATAAVDISIDCQQIEKASFPTSYIPNITGVVLRNYDNVSFPSTVMTPAQGTLAALVCGSLTLVGNRRAISLAPISGNVDRIDILVNVYGSPAGAIGGDDGTVVYPGVVAAPTVTPWTVATKWNSTLSYAAHGGAWGPSAATDATTVLPPNGTICLGSVNGSAAAWNAPISRWLVFNTALDDAGIAAVNTALLAGVQKQHPIFFGAGF